MFFFFFFFFQAEDGIRDLYVTGVQTCALPIFHTFGLRWKDAAELFGRTVKVVHVHGDIGGADAYENRPRPQPGVLVRQAAERIKVVHDEVGSSAEFDAARELISTA